MNVFRKTVILLSACFAVGCSQQPDNLHPADRPSKDWESASVETMNATRLVERLEMLANETELAIANDALGELHYLEVAITSTIDALDRAAGSDRNAATHGDIGSIRSLAQKLHGAGHDQNAPMAKLISNKLSQTVESLRTAYPKN